MWKTVKLSEICLVKRGTTITKKQTVEGEVPVIGGGTKPTYFHNEPNREANCITVSGSGASAGFVNRWDIPIFASDCSTVEPKDNTLLHQFIYYYLISQQQFIYDNFRSGAAQPHVYAKDIGELNFPLIPLSEQQRIVAKLDAAFAEIDTAIEAAAVKETEVQKLKDSLLSSYLNSDSVMWKTVKLGDVCDLSTGGTPSRTKPEYFDNGDVKWLVSGDINQREIFDCDGRITQEGLKSSNAKYLPLNSVLIALNGQGKTRGKVALLRINATCNQSLVAISPKVGCDLDTKYIFYFLDGMYDKIRKLTGDSGNDRRGLNMPLIRNIPFSFPPLAEQQRIVAKLDAAFAEIKNANEAIIKSKLNYQALKTAILAQELQSEAA